MNVRFCVYMNRSAFDNDKRCFERIINLPFGVKYPFDSLIEDFKFLYGDSALITFSID